VRATDVLDRTREDPSGGSPACAPDWETIGAQLEPASACPVWRSYCDGLNRRWLAGHLQGKRAGAALKTDAFDEAVGEGSYAALAGAAEHVYVMDVSSSTCRLAMTRTPGMVAVAGDVRTLPFQDGSLDLVVSLSTLDHFASAVEIEQALNGLHRVLRPGGRLLMTLDNLGNPLIRLRNALPGRMLQETRVVPYPVGATLTAAQLGRALRQAGFDVAELSTLMHIPRAPGVVVARWVGRLRSTRAQRLFCRALELCEFLSALPMARVIGNYVVAAAVKKGTP